MNNERDQLLGLRERIAKLGEGEKKARDIYLSKIASGEMHGPKTGFASIDQPWLANFKMDKYHDIKKGSITI